MRNTDRTLSRIVAIITVFALVVAVIIGVNWESLHKTEPEPEPEEPWFHWYNLDLQEDEDETNDLDFGPNPYLEDEEKDAEYYNDIFRERLQKDPALAAASMAWFDAKLGTRYLGEFYESCKGDWAKTMNEAKLHFWKDQEFLNQDLEALFAFMDTAKVDIRECKGITDQMYMNPHTVDGVPDIIVLATDNQTGYELVYTFVVKGQDVPVAFRINCGFQPTNVAKVMNIDVGNKTPAKPKPVSTPKPTPTPTPTPTPEPSPSVAPSDPDISTDPNEPTISTRPVVKKDPSKAPTINTEPNDNPGPGPDTNNGPGAQFSTKDKPTNSNHFDSYEDYRKDREEFKKVQETQKVGGDSNEPSTPTPPDTTVDNNAEEGTGNGGIDQPTPIAPLVHEADTGKTIISTPGEAWGGPPD